jgi:hypothetical protein
MNPLVAAVAVQPPIGLDAAARALRDHHHQHSRGTLIGWMRHAREGRA